MAPCAASIVDRVAGAWRSLVRFPAATRGGSFVVHKRHANRRGGLPGDVAYGTPRLPRVAYETPFRLLM